MHWTAAKVPESQLALCMALSYGESNELALKNCYQKSAHVSAET